jgi:hypothetical protein
MSFESELSRASGDSEMQIARNLRQYSCFIRVVWVLIKSIKIDREVSCMRIRPLIATIGVLSFVCSLTALPDPINLTVSGGADAFAVIACASGIPCTNSNFFEFESGPFTPPPFSNPGSAFTSLAGGISGASFGASTVAADETLNLTATGFTLDELSLAMTGGLNTIGWGSVIDSMEAYLVLTQPSMLQLSGALSESCTSCSDTEQFGISTISGGDGFGFSQYTPGPVDLSATLQPGTYFITAYTNFDLNPVASGSGRFEISIDASLTPVPEPSWAGLLCAFVIVTAAWRRRRRCGGIFRNAPLPEAISDPRSPTTPVTTSVLHHDHRKHKSFGLLPRVPNRS